MHDDEEPEQLRRSRGDMRRGTTDGLSQRCVRRHLEQQRAERARSVCDRSASDGRIEAERAARVSVERKRLAKSQGGEQRLERTKGICAGEERGGVAKCGHAARWRLVRAEPSPHRCMLYRNDAHRPPHDVVHESTSAGSSLMSFIQNVGLATAICSRVNGPQSAPTVRTPAALPELMSCGESPIMSA
jgi:hypothetical protein